MGPAIANDLVAALNDRLVLERVQVLKPTRATSTMREAVQVGKDVHLPYKLFAAH